MLSHVTLYHTFENISSLACKYDGEWGDCDPFKMIKIKEERLVTGGSECQVGLQEIFLTKLFLFRRGKISQSHVQEEISRQVTIALTMTSSFVNILESKS